jgi:hypothetical protein
VRDDGGVATRENPAWIAAATAAAVRLAAEAGAEVDDVLGHGDASGDLLAQQIVRLERSAEITEVATDLAALLWAECEDVPPIATILEEPETQAALEAVSEARRQAAARLAGGAQPEEAPRLAPNPHWANPDPHWADREELDDFDPVPLSHEAEAPEPAPPEVNVTEPAAPVAFEPAPGLATTPAAVAARRPATGAVLAGAAAAAIVLFGRRLRRA